MAECSKMSIGARNNFIYLFRRSYRASFVFTYNIYTRIHTRIYTHTAYRKRIKYILLSYELREQINK